MTGFLQLMWLLGKGSPAQDTVAEVEVPSADNLRKAAMFEVSMEHLVRRKQVEIDSSENMQLMMVVQE